jgi:ABC-type amino acid transport substrate-binding protein
LDKNNEYQGFDVDVLKAIDDLDDSISIKFETCDWSAMLPGLDAGRYDLCAYQLGKTDEREQMYYFGQMPYCYDAGGAIITTPEHSSWKSFDDIAAAHGTVACIVGSNFTNYVEDYLDKHPNAFQTKYYDSELPAVLEDIANGRVDCTINDGAVALSKAKDDNLTNIELGGYVTEGTPIWFVYANNDRGHELAAKLDKDTKELAQSGKLAEIAKDVLGSTKAADLLTESEYMKK